MTMTITSSWQDNLTNTQPGNYLLTKFESGYRVWRVQTDGTVGGEVKRPEIAALFDRLNSDADSRLSALESASTDDDADEGETR